MRPFLDFERNPYFKIKKDAYFCEKIAFMKYLLMSCLFLVLALSSCGKSDEEIFEEDTAEIIEYLESNALLDDALVTSTGIYYIISAPGNQDKKPNLNNNVRCNYKGYYPSGVIFDENDNVSFILGNTIEGWRQGIRLIGEGGSIQLFIPSSLGYGRDGNNSIPKNQVLIFDVDLLEVN